VRAAIPSGTDPRLDLSSALCENDLLRRALEEMRTEREREVQDRTSAQEALASAKWVLEAQNETLKDVDRAKDAFVANLSHELRTPLTSIVGYLELLTDGVLSEEQRQFAGAIARNSAHLLNMIDDLLSTARIHSGTLELAIEDLDISSLVVECVDDARPRAAAKQIQLNVEPAEGARASADPTRIRQVVVNLVSNAIKFTPPGGEVSVQVTRESDRVVLEVADNGPGIAAADQARVFERFYRTSSAAETAGTGLGLAIVKAIAEAHGGRALLESRLGDGTTFRVELPSSTA
jgi:signal transduction histidine kinase